MTNGIVVPWPGTVLCLALEGRLYHWATRGSWYYLLIKITHLASGLKSRCFVTQHRKNSVKDKVIGTKWIYLERYRFHRQNEAHLKRREHPQGMRSSQKLRVALKCIYYCGQESLRRNGEAFIVNKRVQNALLGCNLKNDRMISIRFQGKPFNITVIQVYAPNK